jgi:DNA-binding PadR family transcriptional regulator
MVVDNEKYQNEGCLLMNKTCDYVHQDILYFLDAERQDTHETTLAAIVKEIRASAKVSRNTVMNRLNDLVTTELVEAYVPQRTQKLRYRITMNGLKMVSELRKGFNVPDNARTAFDDMVEKSQGQPIEITGFLARIQSSDGVGPTFALTLGDHAKLLENSFQSNEWDAVIKDGKIVLTPKSKLA